MSATQPSAHPALTRRGAGLAADGEFHMPTHVFFGRGVAGRAGKHAAGFGAKVIFFGAYVTVMVRGLGLTPIPFAASFTGYFVALLLVEALAMRKLFATPGGRGPGIEQRT